MLSIWIFGALLFLLGMLFLIASIGILTQTSNSNDFLNESGVTGVRTCAWIEFVMSVILLLASVSIMYRLAVHKDRIGVLDKLTNYSVLIGLGMLFIVIGGFQYMYKKKLNSVNVDVDSIGDWIEVFYMGGLIVVVIGFTWWGAVGSEKTNEEEDAEEELKSQDDLKLENLKKKLKVVKQDLVKCESGAKCGKGKKTELINEEFQLASDIKKLSDDLEKKSRQAGKPEEKKDTAPAQPTKSLTETLSSDEIKEMAMKERIDAYGRELADCKKNGCSSDRFKEITTKLESAVREREQWKEASEKKYSGQSTSMMSNVSRVMPQQSSFRSDLLKQIGGSEQSSMPNLEFPSDRSDLLKQIGSEQSSMPKLELPSLPKLGSISLDKKIQFRHRNK